MIIKTILLCISLVIPIKLIDEKPKPWNRTALYVSKEYKIPYKEAEEIADTIKILANNKFPTEKDLLAIISIESRFKHNSKSSKGAKGLMQILYRKTTSKRDNLQAGVDLLEDYHNKLKSKRAAIHAYNLGITNYRNGHRAENYYKKYLKEKEKFNGIS